MNLGKHLRTKEREINPSVIFQTESIPLVLGKFEWGPVNYPVLAQNTKEFIDIFGEPSKKTNINNRLEWFTVDDLFNYETPSYILRVSSEDSRNSNTGIGDSRDTALKVYYKDLLGGTFTVGDPITNSSGFSGEVSTVDSDGDGDYIEIQEFNSVLTDDYTLLNGSGVSAGVSSISFTDIDYTPDTSTLIKNEDEVITGGITITLSGDEIVKFYSRYAGEKGDEIYIAYCDSEFFNDHQFVPGNATKDLFNVPELDDDNMAIVILKKNNGVWTVLENHICSLNPEARDASGKNLFIEEVLFNNSNYVYGFVADGIYTTLSGLKDSGDITCFVGYSVSPKQLTDGVDGAVSSSDIISALDLIQDFDINFKYLVDSEISTNTTIKGNYVTLCESMETAEAVLTLDYNEVNFSQSESQIVTAIKEYKSGLNINNSYGCFAGNCKYRYDRFNDEYFWQGMSSDLAGLRILSDNNYFEWYSSAGFNRGRVRNGSSIQRLGAYYKGKLLDDINKNKINGFISTPADGIICMGDNTMYNTNTGLSKLHIRMLLIVLKSAIKDYVKTEIYEFNNVYTRNRMTSTISQYLERVKSNQGITDFRVICDNSNNTPAVIDANEMVCDIYIKPIRSAEFITLTFTSVGESVKFEEIL